MSKIEVYKQRLSIYQKLERDVYLALGRDGPNNDKHYARASYAGLAGASFSPINIMIDLHHGYYGNSSAYSNTSEELGRYLARAITRNMSNLLDEAVALAKADADEACRSAVKEAQEVLDAAKQETKL